MEQKRVLIPGGRESDWALVNAAHRLGLYVITSGTHANDPAHKFSDEYVYADYADKEAMLALAKEKKIDYMVSNSNDYGMISTAYVCEKLGLPGHDSYETTVRLHTKDTFKAAAKKLGIHSPISEVFEDRDAAIEFLRKVDRKYIVKPCDNVGSNGVSTPECANDIEKCVDFAFANSKKGKILAEPFIEGFFAPATSMIINKKVVAFFVNAGLRSKEGERPGPEIPASGKSNSYMDPCPYMEEFAPGIIEDFEKIAREFDLVDGKLHCELQVTPRHEAYIFDLHRRMSGFQEPDSEWNRSIGMNWEDWIVRAECGMDLSDFPAGLRQSKMLHARNIYAPRDGFLRRVTFDEYLTSHIWPKHEEKNFFLYNVAVTDHRHQPVVEACIEEKSTRAHGNLLRFCFEDRDEWLRIGDPASDEFYKHITFEYYD